MPTRIPTLSRRDLLRGGALAAAGSLLPAAGHHRLPQPPKARAVIQIWMWGGPSHLDTFDPKPEAGGEYCGPLNQPLSTRVPGLRIGELLPRLAKQAEQFAVLRSLSHGSNAHETAAYMVQTGRAAGDGIVHPCAGAVVSWARHTSGAALGLLPPYVLLTQPQGRFSEAGYLGNRYKPFATGGDPARDPFVVEGVVAEGITEARQRTRRELLRTLDTLGNALPDHTEIAALREARDAAYELVLGDAGRVFDLGQEPPTTRDAYGRSMFGQSCLQARRLVEHGVPWVTINYQGWDTHKEHFQAMRRKLPELDKGLATLLEDLKQRGLLDSTIVWWSGEFGRTPRVQWEAPWNGGRGHHGRVFSALLAGGGFRGGSVLGASDSHGEEVADRPIAPVDVIRTIYRQLGIDTSRRLPHPQGHDMPILPPADKGALHGGMLEELL